jgi:excisionase family DNA binding protein
MLNEGKKQRNEGERCLISRLLSARHVGEILEISVKTVNKLVREGKLGCVQVTAKERRFTEEQIRDYIESRSSKVQIDTISPVRVKSAPPKGGEKSIGVSKADLRKEMSQWV